MRPARPSMGITPIQRTCPGISANSAGTNSSSQAAPRDFATGDTILRERNQREPSAPRNTGNQKCADTQSLAASRSETMAPTRPTQLRADCEPVSTEALLNEGSSGE